MDAGRDSGRKIKERNVSGDELKRDHTDRCAEKAAILLENLDKNIDLRPRVKMCLDNGLKRRLDGSRKLQDTSVRRPGRRQETVQCKLNATD